MSEEHKKYPIGEFRMPAEIHEKDLNEMMHELKEFPQRLQHLVQKFSEEQLDTPYREAGWTARQVINHLADSHMNAFIRTKLALTEEHPTIKPYNETTWAELPDSRNMPVAASMKIMEGVHLRWYQLFKNLTDKQLEKTFFHPVNEKSYTLKELLANYIWHGNHHYAHIENLRKEKNWL